MEEEARWNGVAIKNMRGSPQQPDPNRGGARAPIKINFGAEDGQEPEEAVLPRGGGLDVRRFRITDELVRKHW